jgi:hypothetical protein
MVTPRRNQLSFNFCSAPGRGVAANIKNAPNMDTFCGGSSSSHTQNAAAAGQV